MMMMHMKKQMKMHMSLYWGKDAIVLFSGWPNQSVSMYFLAILFVFFLGMVIEILPNKPTIKQGTNHIRGGLIQATIFFFRISFHYLVMLAVMSFNIGIFIAAVAGHTLGFLVKPHIFVANKKQNPESSLAIDEI
jgi:copper transporter 1